MVKKLRRKLLTSFVFFFLESNVRNRFTTAELQTRETTISGNKNAKQKEKKQKNASFAGRSVIDINKAASRQKRCITRTVVKISQRSSRN